MKRSYIFSLLIVSTLVLAACSGGRSYDTSAPAYGTTAYVPKTDAITKDMEKTLSSAQAAGDTQAYLSTLKNIHDTNSKDPIVAARYARALRDDNQINASARILSPFVKGQNANQEALTEMAMTQLALGEFADAERYSSAAIEQDDKNARAYLALGTAQDAQKKHQDAEIAFRAGIEHWKGDATPIMNNLALNLASQGHLEEALNLIEKAQEKSPGRMDLERNRRIIATLLETTGPRAPAPGTKPR